MTSEQAAVAESHWLPDFCTLPVVAVVLLVAELVVLVILLAPDSAGAPDFLRLLGGSAFVQWLAMVSVIALCRLRPFLLTLPGWLAAGLACAVVPLVVAMGSALVFWLDVLLGWKLTLPPGDGARFALDNTVIAALVAVVLFRYFYIRAEWQRQVRAQAKGQADALTARLRPHFLFNTLNAIASLIRSRPQDAERAIEDLSDLLRASLKMSDALSNLADELELVDRYLEIEQLRLGDRLTIERNLASAPRELQLPALILQPLVENAILHGIQRLPAGGCLQLDCSLSEKSLVISLRNPRPQPPEASSGHSIGIDSVRRRLAYHFQDRARLELEPGAGYYLVRVILPRT